MCYFCKPLSSVMATGDNSKTIVLSVGSSSRGLLWLCIVVVVFIRFPVFPALK